MIKLFPTFDGEGVSDGELIELSSFCRVKLKESACCLGHYESLKSEVSGWHQCPFGLSSRSFMVNGEVRVFTGLVGYPRFDTDAERRVAKNHPRIKVARKAVDAVVDFIGDVERAKADAVVESSKVLPQAFHELRKLNGAMLQLTEKEMRDKGESRFLLSIKGATELMRNNFDILEALANLEAMRVMPLDSTVNLYDLAFKMKRVYQERAALNEMGISVNGIRAVINGSQKSFPIVPAVLIENAIKYGVRGTQILVDVGVAGGQATMKVQNASRENIDPVRCFERGVRCSSSVEGGGFGLYLAKEIVQAHGGQISCEIGDGIVIMKANFPLKTVVPTPNR